MVCRSICGRVRGRICRRDDGRREQPHLLASQMFVLVQRWKVELDDLVHLRLEADATAIAVELDSAFARARRALGRA